MFCSGLNQIFDAEKKGRPRNDAKNIGGDAKDTKVAFQWICFTTFHQFFFKCF